MSDMWVPPADDPRPAGSPVGELATYRDYLTHYRMTLAMKCEGLDAEQLARRSVPPSTLSLLGLVRHLAAVEQSWFRGVLQGRPVTRLYRRPDDRDWDFTGAVADDEVVAEAFATWEREVADADAWLDTLDDAALGRQVHHHGQPVSVRGVLVHLVEEYARHLGHADLLRECIDGRTGQ
ncbi:DinB family protein [Fodinibacter luteus]